MANYLITGYWGEPHVTVENDRGINAGIFGTGKFVLPVGKQFDAEYIGNNTIRMYDGKLMNNGAAGGIPSGQYLDFLISNAGQGMKRNDLIVFQYSKDASTLIESGKFVVIQGEETNETPSDPVLTDGDLLSDETFFDQMALWRITVNGTDISTPEKVFSISTVNYVSEKIGINTAGQLDAELSRIYSTMNEHSMKVVTANLLVPDGLSGGIWHITLYKTNNDYGFFTAKTYNESGCCQRKIYDGEWGEWEYENPPMYAGVEYRTTEKWCGMPVYTKLVYWGNVYTGTNTIDISTWGIGNMLRYSGVICGEIENSTEPLPIISGNSLDGSYTSYIACCNRYRIELYANSLMNNRQAYVTIWYTKA